MRSYLCAWILLMLVAACRPAATTASAENTTTWGSAITLAEAEQSNAPAVWSYGDRIVAAWVGTEESNVYQYMRTLSNVQLSRPERLTLPPVFPHQQRLAPAAIDYTHLLWLDADYEDPGAGVRLWSAVITPELLVERGPIQLSDQRTGHYTVASTGDNGLWAMWSGGLLSEPMLYARHIDPAGRPRPPLELVSGADWPALVRTNAGQFYAFWLGVPDGQVHRAIFDEGSLTNITPITTSVSLARGDRLAAFDAGLDATHAYLIWTVARASGEVETWLASGPFDAADWNAPTRLGIATLDGQAFETGFNGGAAQAAVNGEDWVSWINPMPGQFDKLALAAQVGNELGVVYLSGGQVRAYQRVATLDEIGLIGPPSLRTDRNRHLYLAWSQPTTDGYAKLRLTTTR